MKIRMRPMPKAPTRDKVLEYFDQHKKATSIQIGEALNLSSGYVRTTLTRNGRRLALPQSCHKGWSAK